jgi:hypothetical protein
MKSTLLAVAMAAVAGLTGMAPRAHAAAGDSVTFKMVRPASATCLPTNAHARVTLNDLGSVQNMHLEVFNLTPNTEFTLFVTQHNARPFGFAWYQGDIKTGSDGRGTGDFTGIFNEESFIVSDSNTPIQMNHLGIWFADPNDALNAGCAGIQTPFDGDHVGGVLVLSTENFPDAKGPLLQLKEAE